MERIGNEVRRSLGGAGVPDAGVLAAVVRAWPEAVGPAVARASWPSRIARDGTLHVTAVSSTWAFELGVLAEEVRAKLVAALGDEAPPAIRFAPGPVPEPAAAEPPQSPTSPSPSGDDLERARAIASPIDDDALRELVRRAAAASLAGRPSDRSF